MGTFYHLTSWQLEPEHIGATVSTASWDVSAYWAAKLSGAFAETARAAALQHLSQMGVGPASIGLLSDLLVHAKYAQELLKEYIFEEVRAADFSAAPSRKRCIFLFDPIPDPWEYLQRLGFTPKERTLLEVETHEESGQSLRVDATLLNCNTAHHAGVTDHARKYWSGAGGDEPHGEVLFEGNITLKRIIS